jgi:AcrR family transcriptional regulator
MQLMYALASMEATKRRPGGRSARVRAAVLAATLDELGAAGYGAMSLESIARRAGVNKTTIYRRWGSREALVLDLMLERARAVVPVPDTGSLRGDLLQLARAAVANASSPDVEPILRAALADVPQNRAIAAAVSRFWAERLVLDGEIVTRAVARGEIAAGVSPAFVIESLLGPLHMRLLITGTPPGEAEIAAAVELIVRGLA